MNARCHQKGMKKLQIKELSKNNLCNLRRMFFRVQEKNAGDAGIAEAF